MRYQCCDVVNGKTSQKYINVDIGPKISEFRYLLTQGKAASNFSYEEIISFPFFESFLHQENPEQGMMFGDYVDFEEMKKSAEEKKFVRYHFKQIVPGEFFSAKVKPMMVL